MNSELKSSEKETKNNVYCLNCGSKLRGNYCHNCGQQAKHTNLTVKGFVMEYLYNAFMWDPKSLRSMWLLVSKPGLLTKEFLSGRYVSHVHPLKLNMFILLVFITIFLFFSGTEKINETMHAITEDEVVSPVVQMDLIISDPEYAKSIKASLRDTVQLSAPLLLAETYPELFTNLETDEDTQGDSIDKWTAIIPHRLVEDSVIVPSDENCYIFNSDAEVVGMGILYKIWDNLVGFTTRYFPIIILLTVPFLSFSLRLVQYKHKQTRISRFIFSLHYTAFLELFIIFIYFLHLIFAPPVAVLQWALIAASCVYLTMAFRQVYDTTSWGKAIIKSIYTTLSYLFIILLAFLLIFLVIIFVVAFQMVL